MEQEPGEDDLSPTVAEPNFNIPAIKLCSTRLRIACTDSTTPDHDDSATTVPSLQDILVPETLLKVRSAFFGSRPSWSKGEITDFESHSRR